MTITRTGIDDAYDNAMHFPDVPQWRERWQARTAQHVAVPGQAVDVAYGAAPSQRLDIFPHPDSTHVPTALYFHGGFWSRNSKETFRFLVPAFHDAGLNIVMAGYTLAPAAHMAGIVGDALAATHWLNGNLAALGFALRPIVLTGWSAGAHLAALAMSEPNIAGGMVISGVYDLAPFQHSAMNETLRLDDGDVRAYSPALNLKNWPDAPFILAYGAGELPAYREQSATFHQALQAAGKTSSLIGLADRHHHSVLDELYLPEGRLREHLRALAKHATTSAQTSA